MCVLLLSCFSRVRLCVTPWTVTRQAPLSMGFSRQEYWSGVQCSPPGDLPDPGIKPAFLMSPALAGRLFATNATWEALWNHRTVYKSRLLLRTLLAAEVDTDPGMPALHMVQDHTRVGAWSLLCGGPGLMGRPGEHCRRGSSGEKTCLLTQQAHVQSFLALRHRPGLPELPSQEPGVPPSAPWHIHLPSLSVDTGISSPGSPDADSHSEWWEGFIGLVKSKSIKFPFPFDQLFLFLQNNPEHPFTEKFL